MSGVAFVLTLFLYALLLAVIGRALLSWFPMRPGHPVQRALYQVTEPLLAPIRNLLPRTGMIDLSATVLIILIYIMITVVRQAANQ